jgi:hypothetical protein
MSMSRPVCNGTPLRSHHVVYVKTARAIYFPRLDRQTIPAQRLAMQLLDPALVPLALIRLEPG